MSNMDHFPSFACILSFTAMPFMQKGEGRHLINKNLLNRLNRYAQIDKIELFVYTITKTFFMKRFILAFFMALPVAALAQSTEFGPSENGLIYTSKTIGQLKYIVDSLNLKFKVCNASPYYLAKPQTTGYFISMSGVQCNAARKDLQNGISVSELLARYKEVTVYKNLVIIRYQSDPDERKKMINFRSIGVEENNEQFISFESNFAKYEGKLAGTWLISYEPASKDYSAELEAFYIEKEFETPQIPPEYARWIQYSDCLVDTSAQIFTEQATRRGGWNFSDPKKAPKIYAFSQYLNAQYEKDSSFELSNQDARLKQLAEDAYMEAIRTGTSTGDLEKYFEKQGAAPRSLELKRNRIVVGMCSQDLSPRTHALNIATLAAETVNWEIFLRAHLDIMNDNFQRASDGNYAWASRQTYLKELEVLDINVPDLLLGITLRISNPAKNHYDGYIGRIGRALSEYSQPQMMENRLLGLIADNKLDAYNRVLMYYLFLNYNYHLKDQERKQRTEEQLKLAKAGLLLGWPLAQVGSK